ncbi:MAG TPA: mycothiol synthase [Nitriliruptorales bacterium]
MTDPNPPGRPVEVGPVTGGEGANRARCLVAGAERDSPHGELVDEGERQRLDELWEQDQGASAEAVDAAWQPYLAAVDDHPAGYGAILLDDEGSGASAELVVAAHHRRHGIGHTLLTGLEAAARQCGVTRLRIWSRDEDEANRRFAEARGYGLHRRLLILARGSDPVPEADLPKGVTLRAHEPGPDDDEVVRVLNAAFPDNRRPWTRARLHRHRNLAWFDPDGLFVADTGDRLHGLHWTKERGEGVGEVHIMAIAPEGQGIGLGRALLRAGLRHLYDRGNDEVILWMDAENTPAQGLYESEGFAQRYQDAAYARDLT